jgi:hypothetical protein
MVDPLVGVDVWVISDGVLFLQDRTFFFGRFVERKLYTISSFSMWIKIEE